MRTGFRLTALALIISEVWLNTSKCLSMSRSSLLLVLCLLWTGTATDSKFETSQSLGDQGSGVAEIRRSLAQSSNKNGASILLTSYSVPQSILYYLTSQGPGKKTVNKTRPLAHAFPVGWQLLFLPSVVSGSSYRW